MRFRPHRVAEAQQYWLNPFGVESNFTYKTSLRLIRRLGGGLPRLTNHSQNTCRTTPWQIGTGGSRAPCSTAPTKYARKIEREPQSLLQKHSARLAEHPEAIKPKIRDRLTNHAYSARRVDAGRRRTAPDVPHKFARPTPATEESSRARSFARSHARTHATQAQSKLISRLRGMAYAELTSRNLT